MSQATVEPRTAATGHGAHAMTPGTAALALTALGIVFGDIGTSPLYTLKTVVELAGGKPTPDDRARPAFAAGLDADHHHLGQIRGVRHARGQ